MLRAELCTDLSDASLMHVGVMRDLTLLGMGRVCGADDIAC